MLHGVIPPIPTPFVDNKVAYQKLAENVEKWNDTDLAGYLALGSNGEFVYLTEEEKLQVVETVRSHKSGNKILMVGTGEESTAATLSFTNKAASRGMDYALVVTPSYYKKAMTDEVLYEFYRTIAKESLRPILLYNVPQFTGVNIASQVVARLAEHPNIVGIKDSSGNIGQLTDIIRLTPLDFKVFVGSAPVFYPALCVGAVGGILALANIAPRECVNLQRLHEEGDHVQALRLQKRLIPLAQAITVEFGIGGLKAAMDMLGYYGGHPRQPLLPASEPAIGKLRNLLTELNLLTG